MHHDIKSSINDIAQRNDMLDHIMSEQHVHLNDTAREALTSLIC